MAEPRNLPTSDEMRALFWVIFDTLEEEIRNEVQRWWATHDPGAPQILTDPKDFVTDVTYVASVGTIIQLRIDRLADRKHSVLRAIYHELAHFYIAAVGSHAPSDYDKRREVHESGATKLTKTFTDDLKRSPLKRKALRAHPLVERFNRLFDFSPLYIGDRDFAARLAAEWAAEAR